MNNLEKIIKYLIGSYVIGMFIFEGTITIYINIVAIIILSSVWLVKTQSIKSNNSSLILLGFILYCMISILYSLDSGLALRRSLSLALNYASFFIIFNYIIKTKETDFFKKLLILAGSAVSIYLFFNSDLSTDWRLGTSIISINRVGLMLSISLIYSIHYLVNEQRKAYIVNTFILSITLLLLGSRQALLFVAITIIISMILNTEFNKSKLIRLSIGLTSVVTIGSLLIFNIKYFAFVKRRMMNLVEYVINGSVQEGSINIRSEMINVGMDFFERNPLIGYGVDNYQVLYNEIFGRMRYSHNNYIELLVGVGIIGTFIFIAFIANLIIKTYKSKTSNKKLMNINIGILVSYLFIGYVSVYYSMKFTYFIFSIIVADQFIYSYEKEKNNINVRRLINLFKKDKHRILVVGNFGKNNNKFNGQTMRTKSIYNLLKTKEDKEMLQVGYKDTSYKGKHIFKVAYHLKICFQMITWKTVIIMPAQNAIRYMLPMTKILKVFGIKFHIVAIGGWIAEYLKKNPKNIKYIKNIEKVYVQTNSLKQQLIDIGITNAIWLPNFRIYNTNDKPQKKPVNTTENLVCFSRIVEDKGISLAIEAVKILNSTYSKNIKLSIYGPIDPQYEAKFDYLISSNPDVIYKDILDSNEVLSVLSKYDLLVFPTYYEGEGFPGTILDSFSAGVPIVASDWKYNSEIIAHNKTGLLFKPKDVIDLVDKILILINDKVLLTKIRNNCLLESEKYNYIKIGDFFFEELKE